MAIQKAIYIVRHGETEWSKSGQHTGTTDLPLTQNGIKEAELLSSLLKTIHFDHVFTSPLKRAYETCRICGLSGKANLSDALLEWNYGSYEGKKSSEIRQIDPTWNIFEKGGPHGESPEDVAKRVNQFLKELEKLDGKIALFSSGHISRALAVRFLGLPIEKGRHFILSTASVSILTYEHGNPAIRLWNSLCHQKGPNAV